jgi:hypothetical protein
MSIVPPKASAATEGRVEREVDWLGSFALALSLLALALASRYWLAPALERIGATDHRTVMAALTATTSDQPDAPARTRQLMARRAVRVVMVAGRAAIVQGSVEWMSASGSGVLAESGGLYGVDRATRENLPGYGDQERNGHYSLPPRVERATYLIWDPNFRSAWYAQFQQIDRVQGVETYRFATTVDPYDDTEQFRGLAGVPERWRIETEAEGTFWVEPRSGVIVDRFENGRSWFVQAEHGVRAGLAASWRSQYTPETRRQQLQAAQRARLRLLAADTAAPALLAALAALALLSPWWRRRARSG